MIVLGKFLDLEIFIPFNTNFDHNMVVLNLDCKVIFGITLFKYKVKWQLEEYYNDVVKEWSSKEGNYNSMRNMLKNLDLCRRKLKVRNKQLRGNLKSF